MCIRGIWLQKRFEWWICLGCIVWTTACTTSKATRRTPAVRTMPSTQWATSQPKKQWTSPPSVSTSSPKKQPTDPNAVSVTSKTAKKDSGHPTSSTLPQATQQKKSLEEQVGTRVSAPKRTSEDPVTLFHRSGLKTIIRGEILRQRARYLYRTCNRRGAPRKVCKIYWRSQKIFAYNYRTKASNYRGYLLYHWRNKRRIPRYLRRWHRRLAQAKYRGKGGRCYLSSGLAASCMAFAMCSQREAMRDFSGTWGKGFIFPTWGYINYWSNKAYYRLYFNYRMNGRRRPGIRTVLKYSSRWSKKKRRKIQKQLLLDLYAVFMRIVRRKLRHRSNRRLYKKMFCTNIVAGLNSFKRAIPGDLFGIGYLTKRSRRSSSSLGYQHWGLIAAPRRRIVLHNQTPGGLWSRKFHRWGIQYGVFKKKYFRSRWTYKRRKKRYSKRLIFVNRPNVHFFVYAKKRGLPVYSSSLHPHVCRDWIERYSHIYWTNMAARSSSIPLFQPPVSIERALISLRTRPRMSRRRRWVATR